MPRSKMCSGQRLALGGDLVLDRGAEAGREVVHPVRGDGPVPDLDRDAGVELGLGDAAPGEEHQARDSDDQGTLEHGDIQAVGPN